MAGETILIVDDDTDILEIISLYLVAENYNVITATNGYDAVASANTAFPDLILLDMMLPGLDGIEVCQEIRKTLTTPIIFLSCKSSPNEKSIGLIAGGDDYMSKPFDANELLARVKAQLRRNRMLGGISEAKKDMLHFPGLTIDLANHMVITGDQNVILSFTEFQILTLLAHSPNNVISNEQIFQSLWKEESFGDYRTLLVHISNIRKKIEPDPKKPQYIQTVKGVGYRFVNNH